MIDEVEREGGIRPGVVVGGMLWESEAGAEQWEGRAGESVIKGNSSSVGSTKST